MWWVGVRYFRSSSSSGSSSSNSSSNQRTGAQHVVALQRRLCGLQRRLCALRGRERLGRVLPWLWLPRARRPAGKWGAPRRKLHRHAARRVLYSTRQRANPFARRLRRHALQLCQRARAPLGARRHRARVREAGPRQQPAAAGERPRRHLNAGEVEARNGGGGCLPWLQDNYVHALAARGHKRRARGRPTHQPPIGHDVLRVFLECIAHTLKFAVKRPQGGRRGRGRGCGRAARRRRAGSGLAAPLGLHRGHLLPKRIRAVQACKHGGTPLRRHPHVHVARGRHCAAERARNHAARYARARAHQRGAKVRARSRTTKNHV